MTASTATWRGIVVIQSGTSAKCGNALANFHAPSSNVCTDGACARAHFRQSNVADMVRVRL